MHNKIKKGEALFSEGKIEEAERIFSLIIEDEPDNSEANNNLGVVAYIQGDLDKALIYFLRALEKDLSYKDALENLASLFNISLSKKKSEKGIGTESTFENYGKGPEADITEESDSFRGDHGDKADDYYENLWNTPGWSSPHPNLDEKARWGKISSFLNKISKLSPKRSDARPRVLDLGCGRGWLAPLLDRYGCYEGIEPVRPAVDIARRLFPDFCFHKGSAKTIRESSDFQPYDILINTEVIEHIPRDQKDAFVRDMRALLKTNGHLILTTPRGEVFNHMKQHGLEEQPVEDWLTEDEVTNLFEENGFRAIGCERIYLALSSGVFFPAPSQKQVVGENLTAIYQVWAFQAIDTDKRSFYDDHDTKCLSQKNPCVSIIIPCYNHIRFLKDCLQSIIDQTHKDWEAIVVDDCSTDGSPEDVVRSFNDSRIKIIKHERNKGLSASRNSGIRQAQAGLIVTIDADDMFASTFLEKTVAIFAANVEVDCVFTDYKLFGEFQARWDYCVKDAEAMTRTQWIPGAGTLMWSSLWRRVGGYCEAGELKPGNEDWDFWLAASSLNLNAAHVAEPLYFYRQHQVSMRSNLKYYDFATREFIYRRHSQLFDQFNTKNAFLVPGYIDSACEAWLRGERLRAALLAAQGWRLAADRSEPLPVVYPVKEYEIALHQSLRAIENNVHEQSHWLSVGKLAAIAIADKGDLLAYFQKVIGDIQPVGEIIKTLTPNITFNHLGDDDGASSCGEHECSNLGLIGETFFNEGKYEDAKKIFTSITEIEPHNGEAHNNLGVIAYKQGDLHSAKVCFFRALEKDPVYKDAMENLSVIFNVPGDLPLLISCIEKISGKVDHKSEDALNMAQFLLNNILTNPCPTKKSNAALKNSPLKILYLADCRSQHTKRYVRFFKDKGHDVHIFDVSGDTADLDGIQLHFSSPIINNGSGKKFEDVFIHRVFELNKLIEEIKPDILHGHYLSGWCWWGAFTGFQPYLITSWGSDIFLDTNNVFYRRFTEFCLKESPLVTADSMELMEATAALRGSGSGIKYIPFGIDVQFFRPGYEVSGLAKKLGISGSKVVLSPRQFKPPANIDIIIKAIPKVVDEIPDTVFILKTYLTKGSSSDEYEVYLKNLVKKLQVEDRVIFLDDVDFNEMPIIYNLADVMVTLRDTDGSACAMLECMACKTPVVASNIGSMREWIKDGKNGSLVDQHDPDAVARAILEILTDDKKKREYEETSHSLINEKADYRKNWNEVENLYYEVKRNSMLHSYVAAVSDADLTGMLEAFRSGWEHIASREITEGTEAFLNIIRSNNLTAQSCIKALIGLAKIEWLKGNSSMAREYYFACLKLLNGFELDARLDIKI
jgi:glycosyltransferase involved in cell wall biosynthesis/Flp pilus assembly protein TadD/2-polyprenyl-3-methyl-5-hydroxy-6-metoxy-1,4-benzoquinol methylase